MSFAQGPTLHHRARGIHPGAFVQPSAPSTADVQDGVLWVDTSVAEPYPLRTWDAAAGLWRDVGRGATGPAGPAGSNAVVGDCLTFPRGATVCNDGTDVIHVNTPLATWAIDTSGLTLPGGHRLEVQAGP